MRIIILTISMLLASHVFADCIGEPDYPGRIIPEYEIYEINKLDSFWELYSQEFPESHTVKYGNDNFLITLSKYCLIRTQLVNSNLHTSLVEKETFVIWTACEKINVGEKTFLTPACRDSFVSFGPEPPFFTWLNIKEVESLKQ